MTAGSLNDFDKAARRGGRLLDPSGVLDWLLGPKFTAAWQWRRWLDTQSIPFPGEPGRRADTVAECERRAHDGPPLAVVIEFMSQPRGDSLERLAEYGLRLRRELPYQTDPVVKYDVIGVLVNLTGKEQADVWETRPPDCDGLGQGIKVRVVTVATKDAAQTLAAVAARKLARAALVWVPLMAGGGEPATAAEWRRLAEEEPDEFKRAAYGALALVFADLAGCLEVWQKGLEGWNVRRSIVTQEWEAEGEARGELQASRRKLVRALQLRFGPELPAELVQAVQGQADLATLDQWFDLALTAAGLEQVRSGFGLNGA